MSALERFRAENPRLFLLDPEKRAEIDDWIQTVRVLQPPDGVLETSKAGEGNMNCTVRIRTRERRLIVKQSRPWVEKYDFLAAPWDRVLVEGAFYEAVSTDPAIAARMPALVRIDPGNRIIVLEDLGAASDLTGIYAGETLAEADVRELAAYLQALHRFRPAAEKRETLSNREMITFNHGHIFDIPLRRENGLDLEKITPGLTPLADALKSDSRYVDRVTELGCRYLLPQPEGALLHGDFFPGSFLRTDVGLRVIDPEFCFLGDPEFDWSVLLAHLVLAGQPAAIVRLLHELAMASRPGFDEALLLSFTGVEIMRRLIGYAQIARLELSLAAKERLLEQSSALVRGGGAEHLVGGPT